MTETQAVAAGAGKPAPGGTQGPKPKPSRDGKPARAGKQMQNGKEPDPRTPAQIEADIVATRSRLTGRIDELQSYLSPAAVARRQSARIRDFYVDEFGGVRPERVAATAAVALAVVALLARRRRSRR